MVVTLDRWQVGCQTTRGGWPWFAGHSTGAEQGLTTSDDRWRRGDGETGRRGDGEQSRASPPATMRRDTSTAAAVHISTNPAGSIPQIIPTIPISQPPAMPVARPVAHTTGSTRTRRPSIRVGTVLWSDCSVEMNGRRLGGARLEQFRLVWPVRPEAPCRIRGLVALNTIKPLRGRLMETVFRLQ